ncbi:hypothetical protein WR25_20298 [Diploscapter pachys]|uniref:AD domain-containing protein n=1 Tax=Diploscapter pachys TaxID=2018661 RepID=A0A2A2LP93_9BILA|nr:hypothetical protein WR25_20298 [Diploscapter pachys]
MVSLGGANGAFPAGSIVQFNTVNGVKIEGEVVCFDPNLKVLAIKDTSNPNNKQVLRVFNMQYISEIKEVSGPKKTQDEKEEGYRPVTIQKKAVEQRSNTIESKWQEEMMAEEVSLEGQKAFVALRRTIADCRWNAKDIVVLGTVRVTDPYGEGNATIIQPTSSNPREEELSTYETRAKVALGQVQKILASKQTMGLDIPPACGETTKSLAAK